MKGIETFRRWFRGEPPKLENKLIPYEIMLDLETFGITPGCTVLRIGAVRFTPTVILDKFDCGIYRHSALQAGLIEEDSAVSWWDNQSDEARHLLTVPPVYEIEEALLRFNAWATQCEGGFLHHVWGNGAAFDQPIICAAYRAVELAPPWTHKQELCYRTIKEMNRDVPYEKFEGVEHCALADALNQVAHMQQIYAKKGRW